MTHYTDGLVITRGTALRGTAMTLAVVNLSLTSSSSAVTPSGSRHSSACSSDASTCGTTHSASGRPGHCLLPEPKGMNSNRSGMNSSGFSHAAGSRMIAHALKITTLPLGTS
nr:unnamed protein product [Digitaria exilis]